MRLKNKSLRFLWRVSRNFLCCVPVGRRLMFPQNRLSHDFGSGEAEYAWRVFYHHFTQLVDAGFNTAQRILEVGPGQNLGAALLWWAYCEISGKKPAEVVYWDVFENANPDSGSY